MAGSDGVGGGVDSQDSSGYEGYVSPNLASSEPGSEASDDEEMVYDGVNAADGERALGDVAELPPSFEDVVPFLELCTAKWRGAWSPGTYLVPDESMVFWVGGGAPHLTLIPRKPTPLGIMMKTLVCGQTGIMLNAEISEAKEVMEKKEYYSEWGATTATTLRLAKPYFGRKKVVIADSWFGSVRTAFALRK